jgi:hypothetical protein
LAAGFQDGHLPGSGLSAGDEENSGLPRQLRNNDDQYLLLDIYALLLWHESSHLTVFNVAAIGGSEWRISPLTLPLMAVKPSMTRAKICMSCHSHGCSKADWRSSSQGSGLSASAQRPAGVGRINADGTGAQAGLFGEPWRRGFLGPPGDHIGDAQLQGLETHGHDSRPLVAVTAGMGNPPQSAPNQHVTPGTHPSAGIDIPQHQQGSSCFDVISRTHRASMQRQLMGYRAALIWLTWLT